MRAFNGHAETLREHPGAAAMIEMAVGNEQLLDSDAVLIGDGHQPFELVAGIDEGAAHGLGAPEQGAILLERRDRDDDRLKRGFGAVHGA